MTTRDTSSASVPSNQAPPDTRPDWEGDLRAAGWCPVRAVHHQPTPTFEPCEHSTTWRSPSGDLYRGPAGAWKHMKAGAK